MYRIALIASLLFATAACQPDLDDPAIDEVALDEAAVDDATPEGTPLPADDLALPDGEVLPDVRLAIRIAPAGAGTVIGSTSYGRRFTCPDAAVQPICSVRVVRGSRVQLIALPDDEHVFAGWAGCTPDAAGRCGLVADVDRLVTTTFAPRIQLRTTLLTHPPGATLTVSSHPQQPCGTDCTYDYKAPQRVTITAAGTGRPPEYWVFAAWGGACSGNAETCTVGVDDLTQVTARWQRLPAVRADQP